MSDTLATTIKKGDKKTIRGWKMFDWANSAYSLVITSAVFPAFYEALTEVDQNGVMVDLVEQQYGLPNTSLYAYFIAAGFLIVTLLAPLLSGIADYSNNKKFFMRIFTMVGGISCMALYFFDPNYVLAGLTCVMLACVGYAGSLIFNDAFLPEIADPEDHDKISAGGFTYGYIGSVLLLIFNLIMITFPESFGLADGGQASRISFLMVGVWWIGFSQITFNRLPKEPNFTKVPTEMIYEGYREVKKVWQELRSIPVLKWFLSAYFMYNMGVQTIMYMAANIAATEIKQVNEAGEVESLDQGKLILTILIIQLVAAVGAFVFSRVSKKIGNLKTLAVIIAIWAVICCVAYFVVYDKPFFVLAGFVGLVMGGVQSLSRSTYSKLLPETHDHASYFSFYDICLYLSTVCGMAIFGIVLQVTDNIRLPILAVASFFVVGLFLLYNVSRQVKKTGYDISAIKGDSI